MKSLLPLLWASGTTAFLAPTTTTTKRAPSPLKDGGPVSYLSNIEERGKKSAKEQEQEDPRAQTKETEAVNGAPANYDGFIDSEGFDGGDGQVGVVGDGTNAMESYDMSQQVKIRRNAVGGSESKQTRKNVWGSTTGYADSLKKQGMTKVDEYGEDKLAARRQQLENWQNQNELKAQKEAQLRNLYGYDNKEYAPARQGSYLTGLDGNRERKKAVPREYYYLEPGPSIDDHIEIVAPLNGRGGATLEIQNEYSTYADFKAGFMERSHPSITVEPSSGTLNRRGGEPTTFVLKFKPDTVGQTEYRALFIVETDDHKWTYSVMGLVQ